MKNTLLIDKSALLYRLCFGRNVLNKNHEQIGGLLYFIRYIYFLSKTKNIHNIIVVSDSRINKRKEINKEYKSNRIPMPEFIKRQFELINKFLEIANIPNITVSGYEADDVIYNICKNFHSKDREFYILTSDKDICHSLFPNCSLWMLRKHLDNLLIINNKEEFKDNFDIHPDKYSFFLSLAGDKSDNIKGIKNIGKIKAKKIIEQFESLDNLYNKVNDITDIKLKEQIKNEKDVAYESFELVKPKLIENLDILDKLEKENKFTNWEKEEKLNKFTKENLNADIKKILKFWF